MPWSVPLRLTAVQAQAEQPPVLRSCRLDTNKLSGPLPAFKLPASLELLSLHDNQLSGDLPTLTLNVALRQISMHNNAFTGQSAGLLVLCVVLVE